MLRRSVYTILAATALSTAVVAPAIFAPASAQINITFGAPPAPQYEMVPAPRPGYTWAPGYWGVQNNQHVWAPGRWMTARPGERWVPDRWDQSNNQWKHQTGYWTKENGAFGDRDRDGIPNKYDNRDNRRDYGDRDRDGIPNKYDNHDNRRR